MRSKTIEIKTKVRDQFKNITREVQEVVDHMDIKEGYVVVFIPHTTAGVTINENADPDVTYDLIKQLDEMVPWENHYRHFEGNAAAHLKASMMGFSETIIIEDYKLVLGTWQGIYFTEFDGPRTRKVVIKVFGD